MTLICRKNWTQRALVFPLSTVKDVQVNTQSLSLAYLHNDIQTYYTWLSRTHRAHITQLPGSIKCYTFADLDLIYIRLIINCLHILLHSNLCITYPISVAIFLQSVFLNNLKWQLQIVQLHKKM